MLQQNAVVIRTAKAKSYSNIASDICKVNGWTCRTVQRPNFLYPPEADIYIGSQYDISVDMIRVRKVAYITVEGDFLRDVYWGILRRICREVRCVVPTEWGKAVFEAHSVDVADVIPHALPLGIPEPVSEKPMDVVYLNAYYVFPCFPYGKPCTECERKGWKWWGILSSRFKSSLGFLPCGVDVEVPNAVKYSTDVQSVYKLLSLGKVYANLTTHEGFGINPIMALAVGAKVVAWDIPINKEVLGGIDGVYLVRTSTVQKCYVDSRYMIAEGVMEFMWGDIEEYASAVETALKSSSMPDISAVKQKYSHKLYLKFNEFIFR